MASMDKSKGRNIKDYSQKENLRRENKTETGATVNKERKDRAEKRLINREPPGLSEKTNEVTGGTIENNSVEIKWENKKVKNNIQLDNDSRETCAEPSQQTDQSVRRHRHRHADSMESGSNTTNRTSGSIDLKTEFEDAIQHRMTGKTVNCCDMNCTGKCKKYNEVNKIFAYVGDKKDNAPIRSSSESSNEDQIQSHLVNDNQLHGYACIELMLDHFQVNDYILCSTIGKGSFSKVKLGRKTRKFDTGEKNIFTNNEKLENVRKKGNDQNKEKINGSTTMKTPVYTTPGDYIAKKNKHEWFAIKIIPRNLRYNSINKENKCKRETRIFKEAFITSLLSNNHIIKIIDFYYNTLHFFMIYEYIEGLSLLNLIRKKKYLNENESKNILRQLICGVQYLHDNFIVHRDLKIENILIRKDGTVKIIDFGLSNFYNKECYLNTFCGSLQFAAPELLKGIVYHGPEIDVWSLGIILFTMVNGKLPFDDKEITALHTKIKKGTYKWNIKPTPSLEKLIAHMVQLDPLERYSLKKVVKSEWLARVKCLSCKDSEAIITPLKNKEYQKNRFSDSITPNYAYIREYDPPVHSSFLEILNSIAIPKSQFNLISDPGDSSSKAGLKNFPESGLENIAMNVAEILADQYTKIPDYIMNCDREEMMHRFVKDLRVKRNFKIIESSSSVPTKESESRQRLTEQNSQKLEGLVSLQNKCMSKSNYSQKKSSDDSGKSNTYEKKNPRRNSNTKKKFSDKYDVANKKPPQANKKPSFNNHTQFSNDDQESSCFSGGTDLNHIEEYNTEHIIEQHNNTQENLDGSILSRFLSEMPGDETNISLTHENENFSRIDFSSNNSALTGALGTQLDHFFRLYEVRVHKKDSLDFHGFLENVSDQKERIKSDDRDRNALTRYQKGCEPSFHPDSHYTCHLSLQNADVLFTLHFYHKKKRQYLCARRRKGDEILFKRVVGWLREILQA